VAALAVCDRSASIVSAPNRCTCRQDTHPHLLAGQHGRGYQGLRSFRSIRLCQSQVHASSRARAEAAAVLCSVHRQQSSVIGQKLTETGTNSAHVHAMGRGRLGRSPAPQRFRGARSRPRASRGCAPAPAHSGRVRHHFGGNRRRRRSSLIITRTTWRGTHIPRRVSPART